MPRLKFPDFDILSQRTDGSYFEGAAVCRRGHGQTYYIRMDEEYPADSKCPECGAAVLTGCQNCGVRIRGKQLIPGIASAFKPPRPSFCDACGVAHPWATRAERIYELENILDQQDIDEADRVFIHDRLRELRESEGLDEKREKQLWQQIGSRTGKFLMSDPVKKIAETIISAAIRSQLGI